MSVKAAVPRIPNGISTTLAKSELWHFLQLKRTSAFPSSSFSATLKFSAPNFVWQTGQVLIRWRVWEVKLSIFYFLSSRGSEATDGIFITRFHRSPRFARQARNDNIYFLFFTSTLIVFGLARSSLGMVIFNIPFSYSALASSPLTALGKATLRWKEPARTSLR